MKTAEKELPGEAPAKRAADAPAKRSRDNERPLVEDIRLLGRILGDVIREQEGVSPARSRRSS